MITMDGARKVTDLIKKKFPAKTAQSMCEFVKQYYAGVAEQDLMMRDITDLYGAAVSHWEWMQHRKPGDVNLRVYNPVFKQQGWESAHTVIQLVVDDRPFVVDSMLMELNHMGLNIHLVFHAGALPVVRDKKGVLQKVLTHDEIEQHDNVVFEAPVAIEIDRQADSPKAFKQIEQRLQDILQDVFQVTSDYKAMRKQLHDAIHTLSDTPHPHQGCEEEIAESVDFLRWLDADHFTYTGYGVYHRTDNGFELDKKTALGLLAQPHFQQEGKFLEDLAEAEATLALPCPLLISKSSHKSTVHRPAHMDSIGIKHFDDQGKIIAETRFIGLYTSTAYHSSPRYIPFLRRKVERVRERAGFSRSSHDGKALLNVLENFPRDELFQINEEDLYRIAIGVLQIQERQQIRLFIRKDTYRRYYACMVYVPRDVFNTELRLKMQNILMRALNGQHATFTPNFLRSVLCRIDYHIIVDPSQPTPEFDIKNTESTLVAAARDWGDDLQDALIDSHGEHQGSVLHNQYARAFPAGYREAFMARSAVEDIRHIETVLAGAPLGMCFYRMLEEPANHIRFKLFNHGRMLHLTDVLPILENMGLTVIDERPYEMQLPSKEPVWISDFGMMVQDSTVKPDEVSEIFQDAFANIWQGEAENDGFNQLVMKAGMSWRNIMVLRAYAKYIMQTGFHYSQSYMEDTLAENPKIANTLIELYQIAFDPQKQNENKHVVEGLEQRFKKELAEVSNLDKDRILRRFVRLFQATMRTNYYQTTAEGQPKNYLSFKLDPSRIPDLPQPIPYYEIFVYSPRVEGVHLRGASVARGGLRWSDRREDFRTEVLGLMKAQQVKNAVIVPLGAKGGFVPKRTPRNATAEEAIAEAKTCYQTFIRGLLDLTDNRHNGTIIPPKDVVCFDALDPYLVVAADKGTATFSDLANAVSQEYGFWLGDAFASGGSNGYDHKKMGITARGAWESVKRHFLTTGKDIQKEDFTVVGVGDMAGDVFGNGMLLSKHIQLLGAFNHRHIFVDPQPDIVKSYQERKRLFALPRSSWADYNHDVISAGGGVFSRDAKVIPVSKEMAERFDIDGKTIEPVQLIRKLLMAQVDLLWNGGIGTYVKASSETHFDVGDRTNDALRVNADALRCQVIGEGGNLGLTQRGRIEFASQGGLIFTDAIDNSAGVDCSDHEVNIKILLNMAMTKGELTEKQRNALLMQMQDDVAHIVLKNNYGQTQTLNNMAASGHRDMDNYNRLMRYLEKSKQLDRGLEFLPDEKTLKSRKANGKGLTTPELSVLMAYTKTAIKRSVTESRLAEDAYFESYLFEAFPQVLVEKYAHLLPQHQLAKEIILTQLTNKVTKHMGIAFCHRLQDETGALFSMILRVFAIVNELLNLDEVWSEIEALDGKVPSFVQSRMMNEISKVVRRICRWFLRNRRGDLSIMQTLTVLRPKIAELKSLTKKALMPKDVETYKAVMHSYIKRGVPKTLAKDMADFAFMVPMMDIIEGATRHDVELEVMVQIYSALSTYLSFTWVREALMKFSGDGGYWDILTNSAMRDDLDKLQRTLTVSVIENTEALADKSAQERVDAWMESYQFMVDRWHNMVEELQSYSHSLVRFTVAFRVLLDLSQATTYGAAAYASRS